SWREIHWPDKRAAAQPSLVIDGHFPSVESAVGSQVRERILVEVKVRIVRVAVAANAKGSRRAVEERTGAGVDQHSLLGGQVLQEGQAAVCHKTASAVVALETRGACGRNAPTEPRRSRRGLGQPHV